MVSKSLSAVAADLDSLETITSQVVSHLSISPIDAAIVSLEPGLVAPLAHNAVLDGVETGCTNDD